MAEERPPVSVSWPSDEERRAAFDDYTRAVGSVVHAWNYLHEQLGQLFVAVSRADRAVTLSVWYSNFNDRAQRRMLRAAVMAAGNDLWPTATAKDDTIWLLDRADDLSRERNNAIHAPCSLYIGGREDGGSVMGAAFFTGHPNARRLVDKRLLAEFGWCEAYAETLSRFTNKVETGLAFADRYPWPERPELPPRP
jgi:hypothetical protein